MKRLKIITGRKNRSGSPYWTDWYVARAFRKLGHVVDETGDLGKRGFNLGFVVIQQSFTRRQWRGYPVGFWGIDCRSFFKQYRKIAARYDVMFVDSYDMVQKYKPYSKKAIYLPYACDPAIHKAVPAKEVYDIGFVGRYSKNRGLFLNALIKSGLKVKIHWSGSKYKPPIRKKLLTWPQTCKLYSQCKMIFNCSKDATNKRTFEAMSIGKLVLTRRKKGSKEPDNLFKNKKHLIVYIRGKDLVAKAKYYASHPTERRAIAKAGQQLVHKKHKWTDRMHYVINALKKYRYRKK